MSKGNVIISGVVWTVVNNLMSILYGVVSVPFLINYFGKEEYGLIGIAVSVNVYIYLLDMGMTNSNIRFFSEFIAKKETNNVQKLFSLTSLFYIVLGVLNSIILFSLSFFVQDLFKVTSYQAEILKNLILILAINATFSWISSCFDQFIRANDLIAWIKKRSTLLKFLQFIILIATIIYSKSIEFYFFGYIFLGTVILPLSYFKSKSLFPALEFNFKFDREIFNRIFPYAVSIFSFSIFQFIAFNSRPLFLGNISGPGAVAEYNIMITIASVVTMLSGSFMQVLLPVVTKLAVKSDWIGINRIISDGTKFVNIVLSLMIFALIIVMEEIFILYVGEEYAKLYPWMVLWLLTLLLSHRNVMTSIVFTETKLKSVAIMGAIAMAAAIGAYVVFVPIYGVGGVVIGFGVHELVHTLYYYVYFLRIKLKIDTRSIFLKSVLPIWVVLGTACVIIGMWLDQMESSTLFSALFKITVLGAAMILLVWFVLLTKNNKSMLKNLLFSRK